MKTFRLTIEFGLLGHKINPEYINKIKNKNFDKKDDDYISLLDFFKIPPQHLEEDVLKRYVETSNNSTDLPILPLNEQISDRLFNPLKSAKKCYCFGEYMASIHLSAYFAEMLALLVWKVTPTTLKNLPISLDDEKMLFGKNFEELGQERRLKILAAFGAIKKEQYNKLNEIRTIRNQYYHFWEARPVDKTKPDALKFFKFNINLVKDIVNIRVNKGKLTMDKKIAIFLSKDTDS